MDSSVCNMADVVILTTIFAVVVLIIRGMLRGTIRTCDPASCGSCNGCGRVRAASRINLSDEQLAQLREIDRRAREA